MGKGEGERRRGHRVHRNFRTCQTTDRHNRAARLSFEFKFPTAH
ncbi:hypothetical protein I3843_06G158600 [Carya illinoinensis]|nr:hypothetical protein I3843_06G158600 [Carya illinoinensis]